MQDEGDFSFEEGEDDNEDQNEPEFVETFEQDLSTFDRAISKEPVIM